jgi:multiple sugar transport system permease protein
VTLLASHDDTARSTGRTLAQPAAAPSHRRGVAGQIANHLMVLPAALFLLIFAAYPIVMTIVYSFEKVTVPGLMTHRLPFVGLDNYLTVLADPGFMQSARISAIFTIASVFFQFVIGFSLALLFNERFALRGALRGLIMLGWVLPIIVVGTTFKWMFQNRDGVINALLNGLFGHSAAAPWLEQPTYALIAIIIANIWLGVPFMFAMLLAGLQTIPASVHEAARIDGATAMERLRHVTLPLMRGPSLIVLTLSVIYTLNVFEIILVITGGGPGLATSVVTYYAYQQGFQFFKLGPASAVTVLVFLVLAAVSALYIRLLRKSERY